MDMGLTLFFKLILPMVGLYTVSINKGMDLLNHNTFQGFVDVRVLKDKPMIQQSSGNHPLAFEDDRSKFSQDEPDHESRGGEERRPMQGPSE
jgi:hypothetical protein